MLLIVRESELNVCACAFDRLGVCVAVWPNRDAMNVNFIIFTVTL